MSDKNMHDSMKRVLEQTKMAPSELAAAINTSPQNVTNWSKRGLSKKGAMDISKRFGLSMDWLLTGAGSPHLEGAIDEGLSNILKKGSVSISHSSDGSIRVPVYEIYFCCGDGNDAHFEFEEVKDYHSLPEDFFTKRNIKPENFKMVCAVNDSMSPYINHGDEVGIVINDREIRDGQIYAILLDGDRMFKQIFREAGGALRLHSFNPAYPDKIVTAENHQSLIIVGRQEYRAG